MRPYPLLSELAEGEIQHAAYFPWEEEGRPPRGLPPTGRAQPAPPGQS